MKKKMTFGMRLKKSIPAYLFLLPLFTGILTFSYYPALSGIYHSFFNWNGIGEKTFIGFQNYQKLFQDAIFLNSIKAMLKLMIPKLVISIVVPFIMAELIYAIKAHKMQAHYRMLCLLPMVAPGVVGTLLWKYIYDPSSGLAVEICRLLGIIESTQNIDWLGNPSLTIGSIIFMGFPWIGGTAVLIYMSGLLNISSEVMEAAQLDGCSTLRRIFSIDVPLMMGQVRYFVIVGIINALQDYSVQIILTEGGPGYTTYVPGYYMFKQAFSYGNMGYACSIGILMFAVIFLLTILSMRLMKNKD